MHTRLILLTTFILLVNLLAMASAASPPIVISGATGRVGSAVVNALLKRYGTDNNVFLLTRDVAKAEALHSGVQCLPAAAYDDVDALDAAFSGVPDGFRLFLACSNGPTQATLESNICRAAHKAGCSYAVKLSTASAVLKMKAGGPYAAHLEVEELLRQLRIPHAILRPNLFLDEITLGGFLGVCGPLKESDTCSHPFAESPVSAVDVRDVGEVAAALLASEATEPEGSVDGVLLDVTGPAAIRLGVELAQAITELRASSSKPAVAIEACTVDEFLEPRGLPPPAAASLGGFLNVIATECAEVTDTVERLTGRPPRSVEQFVRDNADAFAS